jgi:hypothetical protein
MHGHFRSSRVFISARSFYVTWLMAMLSPLLHAHEQKDSVIGVVTRVDPEAGDR